MRTFLILSALVALPLHAGLASAIELQVVDSSEVREGPSLPGQAPAPCTSKGFNDNDIEVTSSSIAIQSQSWATSYGEACDAAFQFIVSQTLVVSIIGPPGVQAQICYVTNASASALAEGPVATSSANLGGSNPVTMPGGIYLNAAPISEVKESLASDERFGDSDRGIFTVTPGDQITMVTGTRAGNFFPMEGPGSASADAIFRAAIYVGDCPRERAPAASASGLGLLALTLASLGVFGARRLRR